MRAYVLSRDKLTFEVVLRTLRDAGFAAVDLLDPRAIPEHLLKSEQVGSPSLIFLDLDAPEAEGVSSRLISEATVLEFGGHEHKARAKRPTLYLRKPFAREQIEKVVSGALMQSAALPAVSPVAASIAPALLTEWQAKLRLIRERREQLKQCLNATPEQLRALLKAKTASPEVTPVAVDLVPVRRALIVCNDEADAKRIMHALAAKCVVQADIVETGAAAWEALGGEDPAKLDIELLVMNWELAGLNGLGLYNRLRMSPRWRHLPIVITSAKLKVADMRLLAEDSSIGLAGLPLQEKQFADLVSRVVSAAVLGREFLEALTTLVKASLAEGSLGKGAWLKSLAGDEELVMQALRLAGDECLGRGELPSARAAYSSAWQLGDRRLALLTGYAKVCYGLGDKRTGSRLVSVADALAPHSIERLCLLGESELSFQHVEAARQYFDQALAIDPDCLKARAGLHVADVCAAHGGAVVGSSFASYLNLLGIQLSRSGKVDEAHRYYQAALYFVYRSEEQSKLWFNIGIGYLRAQRRDESKEAFKQAYALSGNTMVKALKYLEEAEKPPVTASLAPTLDYAEF